MPGDANVEFITNALIRDFGGHNLVGRHRRPEDRHPSFLTRALAALIVRDRTGCDPATAAAAVTDGGQDFGIDAVGIAPDGGRVWLVQTKWSDAARATVGENDVVKIIDGLVKIENHPEFDRFNPKMSHFAEPIRAVLRSYGRVTIVLAYLGSAPLDSQVSKRIAEDRADHNRYDDRLDFEIVAFDDILTMTRRASVRTPIDLSVSALHWFDLDHPMKAVNGVVTAADVARWYAEHGNRLFAANIRESLGVTSVNAEIARSLTDDPAAFWYRNNGITMLCDRLDIHPENLTKPHEGRATIDAHGVSIINGAQTVAAVARAVQDHGAAGSGLVGIRVIQSSDPSVGREITEATNTQNGIERRDFAALDPVQIAIQEEFASLGLAYSIRRGELEPAHAIGCTVRDAALALACAHPTPELAYRARQNEELLWERGEDGAYTLLFGEGGPGGDRPSALQLWRSVQLWRAVRETLARTRSTLEGRAAAIAEYGDLVIAHLVFQQIGREGVDDQEYDWEREVLAQVDKRVEETIAWVVGELDRRYGTDSLVGTKFSSAQRVREFVRTIVDSVQTETRPPTLPASYRPDAPARRKGRRKKPVPVLVDAARLKDGAQLTYRPTSREQGPMRAWLAADPRRGRATWVNSRSQPLVWEFDGKRYSPSALVLRMWTLADWTKAPGTAHGELRWVVKDLDMTIQALAEATAREEGLADEAVE